jgi:hypothetical protein
MLNQEKQLSLSNKHTNWDQFRLIINERLILKVPLKTEEDIETAAKLFNDTMQWAGWNATPEHAAKHKANNCPIPIKQKIEEKEEDSAEIGTNSAPRRAKGYSTQQHKNSSNFSTTKMTAFELSYKNSHQQNPLTIPCGRLPRK